MRWTVLLPLVALLGLAACGPGVPPHVVVDPAMLSLVPEDTVTLIGMRIDHLRETSFYEKHVANNQTPGLEGLIEHTGLDPENLWELLVAHNGVDAILMARGKFTEGGLEPRIEWEGANRSSYKGYLIVSDQHRAITFMNPTTAAVGTPARVREIIDMRGNSNGPPEELIKMIEEIDRSNQIWVVSTCGLSEKAAPPNGPMANLSRVMQKIDRFTAMMNLHDGLRFEAHAVCATATDAESLQAALQALIGLGRFGMRDQPAMIALYDQIAVTHTEQTVDIHADVPAELVDQLMTELPGTLPR